MRRNGGVFITLEKAISRMRDEAAQSSTVIAGLIISAGVNVDREKPDASLGQGVNGEFGLSRSQRNLYLRS